MDLVQYFYSNIIGKPIENELDYIQSKCTIEYLQDCQFSDKEIIHLFEKWNTKVSAIKPEDIPTIAWEQSLLKKNKFYLHKELKLFSIAPIVTPDGNECKFPYYLETKIRYTTDDVLQYFYEQCAPHANRNIKLHKGQIEHILQSFKGYKGIEPIDLLLSLIDECHFQNFRCIEPFDLTRVASIIQTNYEKLKSNLAELHANGRDIIIWRTQFRTSYMNSVLNSQKAFNETIM